MHNRTGRHVPKFVKAMYTINDATKNNMGKTEHAACTLKDIVVSTLIIMII